MRHADLRREPTPVIAKAASALLYHTAVWYLVCMGVWRVLWWDERYAMGSKTGVKLFRLTFSTDRSSRKSHVFRLDPPVGKLSRKKLSRKSPSSTV